LPLKYPRNKSRCLKASSSFFHFDSQLWEPPLPAGTRIRSGSAGASQHLRKGGNIHTCPRQGLKSLILSAGEDCDKDLPRQARPQEITQPESSIPYCLAWDSYVPTNTPGQSELLQMTHFLALHPVDT